MSKRMRLYINIATGVLGLAVGGNYLYRWFAGDEGIKAVVIGVVCLLLGAGWLIYSCCIRGSDSGGNISKTHLV